MGRGLDRVALRLALTEFKRAREGLLDPPFDATAAEEPATGERGEVGELSPAERVTFRVSSPRRS